MLCSFATAIGMGSTSTVILPPAPTTTTSTCPPSYTSQSTARTLRFIIADEGFACREHILRPYNKRTDDLEKILFNFVFKSTRLLVENAIGAWKQKCPLLNVGMHKMEPQDLAKTILASGVLYQLWKMTNEKVRNLNTKEYTDKPKYIPSRFHHASSATVE